MTDIRFKLFPELFDMSWNAHSYCSLPNAGRELRAKCTTGLHGINGKPTGFFTSAPRHCYAAWACHHPRLCDLLLI